MQIKTTMSYHSIPFKRTKIKYSDNTKYWQRCREIGTNIAGGSVKWYRKGV